MMSHAPLESFVAICFGLYLVCGSRKVHGVQYIVFITDLGSDQKFHL